MMREASTLWPAVLSLPLKRSTLDRDKPSARDLSGVASRLLGLQFSPISPFDAVAVHRRLGGRHGQYSRR